MSVTLRRPKPIVTQSKMPSAKGRRSAFTCAHVTFDDEPFVDEPVAPACEHRGIDVREHDVPARAHLLRKTDGEIAGAAGDIQRALSRMQVRERRA